MTVPVDTILNFAIGQGLALVTAHRIHSRQSPLLGEGFGYAVGFATACFAPLGLFLFWAYPDWSTMYTVVLKPGTAAALRWVIPWWYVAACAAGYAVAHRDLRAGRPGRARGLFIVALVLETAVSLAGYQRLVRVGTLNEFQEGTARWIWQDPLAPLLVSIGALFALSLALLVQRLRRPEAG